MAVTDIVYPAATRSRPLVSVVIATRNRSDLVSEAIQSVLDQEHDDFDIELVIIDDGSTDDTQAVLSEFPIDRLVVSTGVGMAGARNLGVRHSTGDFIQVLDDDDVLTPSSLASRLAVFTEHPEYGAVHGTAQMTDMDLNPVGVPIPEGDKSSGWILEDLLTYFPQIGTVLTRRIVFSETGGFLRHVDGDDWDLYLQTAQRWPIGRVDDVAMLFRQRVGLAEESQQWRRSRGNLPTFLLNTQHLPLVERIRLRPVLWRMRGWNASVFVRYARMNWASGERVRAIRSLGYAFRWSPLHTPLNIIRIWRSPVER